MFQLATILVALLPVVLGAYPHCAWRNTHPQTLFNSGTFCFRGRLKDIKTTGYGQDQETHYTFDVKEWYKSLPKYDHDYGKTTIDVIADQHAVDCLDLKKNKGYALCGVVENYHLTLTEHSLRIKYSEVTPHQLNALRKRYDNNKDCEPLNGGAVTGNDCTMEPNLRDCYFKYATCQHQHFKDHDSHYVKSRCIWYYGLGGGFDDCKDEQKPGYNG